MKPQLIAVLLILIFAGIGAMYATGQFKFSIDSSYTSQSGCRILKPVLGEYCCKKTAMLPTQWNIPENGGWLDCKGNRWDCTFTITPETHSGDNGYFVDYEIYSASGISIEKGTLSFSTLSTGQTNPAGPHTKTFSLINGQSVWINKYYYDWGNKKSVSYTVSGSASQIFLTRSEDAAQNIPVNTWTVNYDTDGCHIRSTQSNDELSKNAPLDLTPQGACQPYYTSWIDIPNLFNTVTYQGKEYACLTKQSGGRALYLFKRYETTNGAGSTQCFDYPETFFKDVDCCSATDHPPGYYCDTNTFTLQAEQPSDQGCQSDLQCEGGGSTYCQSTLLGNKIIKSGGCDLTTRKCVKNVELKGVDCCPNPNTCQSGYYCSVSQGYICIKSEPGAQTCPYQCCDGSGGYQVKACAGGYTCCQGTCPTAENPVCCGNGAVAKTQSDCGGGNGGGTNTCAKEGQTPSQQYGCCEGYVVKEIKELLGSKLVCTKGSDSSELMQYLPWILLGFGAFVVIMVVGLKRKSRR